jgi:DNA gyrase subunit B
MAKNKPQDYSASSIKELKGLEAVRRKPGMYMGERGDQMVWRQHKELVDNSVDEMYAGRNDTVEQYLDPKNNRYIVADHAMGIPIGKNEDGKEALDIIFTSLHGGGKFDDKAYKNSAGTHGVGAACSNALSTSFRVWTHWKNKWHYRQFKKGVPVGKLVKVKAPDDDIMECLISPAKSYGSIIVYEPDQSIVAIDSNDKDVKKKTQATIPTKQCVQWSRMIALMNPGLKMIVTVAGGKTYKFWNKKDIGAVVTKIIKDNDLSGVAKPLVISTDNVDLTLQWTSHDDTDLFRTYVNCSPTKDNGKHYEGFTAALGRVLQSAKTDLGKKGKKDTFKTIDALYGMVGILNFKMSEPEFSSQTKDRLTSHVNKDCEEILYPLIAEYFKKHKNLAKIVINRALAIAKGRDELKKVMKSVSEVRKGSGRMLLPNILCAASKAKPHEREIYIVEGDSAGGCFIGSTEVLLSDGSTLTFEEMAKRTKQGEVFFGKAFDINTQEFVDIEFDEPRLTKYASELIEVELSNGDKFVCTPDHPWLIGGDTYTAAESLQEGDCVTIYV